MDGPSAFDNFRGRITELEQSLAASEARVVELERERDEASRLADEVAGFYRTAVAKLVAAESAASTAMRDGMMEAARIGGVAAAEYVRSALRSCDLHPGVVINMASGVRRQIEEAIRTRASSLPGGEGKTGDDDPYRPEMVEELLSLVGEPRPPVGTVEDGR